MKRIIISFGLFFAMGAIYAESGTLTVTSVESAPFTGITVITYDLTVQTPEKVNETYNIWVEVSFDGGGSYIPVPPADLSGDVENVAPGTSRQITWNGAASFPNRYSTQTKVRLTAAGNTFNCGGSTVTFIYNGSLVTYGTVVGADGRCWLDRNLGASHAATSSTDTEAYGDLFQWGRAAEGHQVRTSDNHISGLATTSDPNAGNDWDGKFITSNSSPSFDWLSAQDVNLWQGVNGVNKSCPPGFRLPTGAEWDAELNSWSSDDAAGAFGSPLKLPLAGGRNRSDGSLTNVGSSGYYWSSSVDNTGSGSRRLRFYDSEAVMGYGYRAYGYSVRCIKN